MTAPEMSDCTHPRIQSWVFADGQPARFWSCSDCGLKFTPIDRLLKVEALLRDARDALVPYMENIRVQHLEERSPRLIPNRAAQVVGRIDQHLEGQP